MTPEERAVLRALAQHGGWMTFNALMNTLGNSRRASLGMDLLLKRRPKRMWIEQRDFVGGNSSGYRITREGRRQLAAAGRRSKC